MQLLLGKKTIKKSIQPHSIVLILIFFSGFSALIYELIWVRLLHLYFGVSGFAVATVVAVFMLGLALGSLIFGKISEQSKNPLKSYAYLELGIALTSILSFVLLKLNLFDYFYKLLYNSNLYLFSIFRLIIAVIILLLPCLAIGGTIPLVTKYLIRNNNKIGSDFSIIYYLNTFGGVAGVLFSGLFLIKHWGVIATFALALLINISIFIIALYVSKNHRASSQKIALKPSTTFPKLKYILPLLFLTGFISLGYEVLWIRSLANIGLSISYSFTLILAGFLLGIMTGSFILSRIIGKINKPLVHFSIYLIITSVLGSVVFLLHSNYSHISQPITRCLKKIGLVYQPIIVESIIALFLSLIPAVSMGMIFPLGVSLYINTVDSVGKRTGKAYFINTIGSLAGCLLMGFVLIPFIGIKYSTLVLVLTGFLMAGYLIILNKSNILWFLVCVALIFSLSTIFVNKNYLHRTGFGRQIFYGEGLTGSVLVKQYLTDKEEILKLLFIDSNAVAGTFDFLTIDSKILAHLPLLLVDSPQKAVSVGLGTGGTSYSMLKHGIDVYTVEIEKKVVNASKHFEELNHGFLSDKNLHIVIDDARNYFRATDLLFDVIVTDVTTIKYKSNPSLYSQDYFKIIASRLSKDGIAAAWIPLSGVSFSDIRVLAAGFKKVFPHTTLWSFNQKYTEFMILIGSAAKLSIDLEILKNRMASVQDDLNEIDVENEFEIGSMLWLGEHDVNNLTSGIEPHTDNNPVLEFSGLNSYIKANGPINRRKILQFQSEDRTKYFRTDDIGKLYQHFKDADARHKGAS